MLHETIKKKTRRRSVSSAAAATAATNGSSRGAKRDVDRPDGVLTVAPLLKEVRRKFAQFRGSYQQDAHELLLSFLWAIDEEADPPPTASSPLSSSSGADTADLSSLSSSSAASSLEPAATDVASDDSVALKQIFIKTDTGDTVTMQVPLSASMTELQQLIAKRLNIAEDDMALSHARLSVAGRPTEATTPPRVFSKLNFTRHLFGGELTTYVPQLAADATLLKKLETETVGVCIQCRHVPDVRPHEHDCRRRVPTQLASAKCGVAASVDDRLPPTLSKRNGPACRGPERLRLQQVLATPRDTGRIGCRRPT